jgi:phage portal protein BeeE
MLSTTDNEYPLTKEQFGRMQNQMDRYMSGTENSGRPLVGENMRWQEIIVNNRDMDYENLSKNAQNSIYKRFDIPLPLVENDSQTYNNYAQAMLALYDMGVLPLTQFLFNQLSAALIYRFRPNDYRDLYLTYDEENIKALQIRRTEAIKLKKEVGVHLVNELRADFGDEPKEGLDVLLRPANEIDVLDDDAYQEAEELSNPPKKTDEDE